MAFQSTIDPHPHTNLYVSKTTFWWAVGLIILLIAAISFSMSRDISRLSLRTHHESGMATDQATGTGTAGVNSTGTMNGSANGGGYMRGQSSGQYDGSTTNQNNQNVNGTPNSAPNPEAGNVNSGTSNRR
jgi:hypothetical protein